MYLGFGAPNNAFCYFPAKKVGYIDIIYEECSKRKIKTEKRPWFQAQKEQNDRAYFSDIYPLNGEEARQGITFCVPLHRQKYNPKTKEFY